MIHNSRMTRRSVVRYAGVAILSGVAGCVSPSSNESTETDEEQSQGTEDEEGQEDHDNEETEDQETEDEEDQEDHDDDHENSHSDELDSPVAHADVEMVTEDDEHHFEPHAVRIEKGGTVTWTLISGAHSATAYHSDNDRPDRVPTGTNAWDSDVLSEEGATFEHTFDEEGVYDYFCRPHESVPMIGTVLVGQPDPENQPGLASPQDDFSEEVQTAIEDLNQQVSTALSG